MINHHHLFVRPIEGSRAGEVFCEVCKFSKQECFEIEKATHCNTDLRDQFAMAALSGLLTNDSTTITINYSKSLTKTAYELADAMLEARKQNETKTKE